MNLKLSKRWLLALFVFFSLGFALTFFLPSLLQTKQNALKAQSLPTIVFEQSKCPNIYKHIRASIRSGRPSVLQRDTNKTAIRNRRNASCGRFNRRYKRTHGGRLPAGKNCDEYPFASTSQGGASATTMYVPTGENSRQGTSLNTFYRRNRIGNNDRFKVAVAARNSQTGVLNQAAPSPNQLRCGYYR